VVSLTPWASAWGVPGVSRLHYSVRTGRICSKSFGGHYASQQFGQRWHPVLQECLRIRAGLPGPSLYATAAARRQDALAFVQMVIDDGVRPAVGN
jgi:aminoglycoside adenylyltransferase-like protein